MVELPRAVDALVDAAMREVPAAKLKGTVEKVLAAFDEADEAPRAAALRTLGRALGTVTGRGAQILSLALGALVESGASPEVTWPSVGGDLDELLVRATSFARAAIEESDDEQVETAIESAGAAVAKKKPREADAWKALPSRCLAAVACLTHSKKLRSKMRKAQAVHEAAWPLSDVVDEVGYLFQALRILDDETLLVLAPELGRGWRVAIDEMPSNAELYILLADALLGGPSRGRLKGDRPNAKAVTAIRTGTPPKGVSSVKIPFELVEWTALGADGSVTDRHDHGHDHTVRLEGIPWDIPEAPGKKRVVILQKVAPARTVAVSPSFEALRPAVTIAAELSATEVGRTLVKLGTVAAAMHSHEHAHPPAKKPKAKKTKKKKKKKKKKKAAAKRRA
jgi:hypothetical protein